MQPSESPAPRRAPRLALDYMVEPVYTVGFDATVREIDRALEEHGVSAVVVEDVNGDPVGVVSRGDLIRVARRDERYSRLVLSLPHATAGEVMRPGLVTVAPDAPMEAVARRMAEAGVHRVFVMDARLLLGVIGAVEILRAVIDRRIATPLGRASSGPLVTVEAKEPLAAAARRFGGKPHGVVVLDEGWPVGVLDGAEMIAAASWPADVPVADWMQPRLLCLPPAMPLFRAAGHALHNDVRHLIAMDDGGMKGILTGIDFARCLATSSTGGS